MNLKERAGAAVAAARRSQPWLDHVVRAAGRYKADGGDRLAASLTFYGFLSLFPLMLLGVSVLGYLLNGRQELQQEIFDELVTAVPGLADTFAENLELIRDNAGKTGIVALIGVLLAGLGGVTALRDSLRLIWHQSTSAGNLVTSRLRTLVTLVGLGLTLVASVAVSAVASSLMDTLLDALGVGTGTFARLAGSTTTLLVALLADIALFLFLFRRLPDVDWPFRQVLRGAIFGAVGFGVLKLAATYYVGRAVANNSSLYGPVGAVIGILVGINLISRFVLYTAAWTVTAPGWDDVPPSVTALDLDSAPATARSPASMSAVVASAEGQIDQAAAARTRMAAGVVLGAAGTGALVVAVVGVRAVWRAVRPR